MSSLIRTTVSVCFLAALCAFCGGCAYMQNRGNDALDILDVGITVSTEPHVAAYAGFQSLLALGYSEMDGKLIGIGQRQVGILDMRYNAGGMLLEGHEQFAYGKNFDPADPESPPRRGAGLGLIYHESPRNAMEALQCAKFVHLLFIGADLNCKIGEVVDFVLGWTTLDIGRDDVYPKTTPGAS